MQQACENETNSAVHCPNSNIFFSKKGAMKHWQKQRFRMDTA